ncbi:hypothetical protein PFAG_01943 [Plasmodium falciparum Santa Lucia]|uniref:Uncharacterized protein n=1 Tax=Plasmodium falciparum Santa Lucia TaxID=478859 RepID=W7G862_PLAFA|nr:hypothetical protein PFAG_01943 [Plasmodium falciparum Santa Lucia]
MSYVDLSGYKIPKKMFDELNPFERHKLMMSLRSLEEEKKKENKNEKYLSDYDILRKKYNFIHDVTNVKVRACMDCAYKLHYRKINKYLKKKEKEKKKKKIKEKKKRKKKKGKKNKSDLTSESDLSSSYNSEDRSQSKREKLYYVKKKLEKISIKKKEEMNEDNLFFHDLLF